MLELQRFFIQRPGIFGSTVDYDILDRNTGQKVGEIREIVVGEEPS